MNKAFKFRIYPNEEQKVLIAKTFGCVRFAYNKMLSDRIDYYNETGQSLKNTPAQYKGEFEWLREVDSLALANAQMNLNKAYKNFFQNSSVGFPKFKSKKSHRRSYTTNQVNGNIKLVQGSLTLPKLKNIKIKQHREVPEDYRLKSVTVSLTSTGKYFASLLYEYEHRVEPVEPVIFLGLDFSMKELYVPSEGEPPEYPRYYRQALIKLKKEQRKLSKCQLGSQNWNKQRIRLSRQHEHVANQRREFHHQKSMQITNAMDVVCIEDLNMKDMSQVLNFGMSISDNGFRAFIRILEYKLEEQGKQLVKIDKWFPSSKMCSCCGEVKKTLLLSERTYHCEACGMVMDRDKNASLNIKNEGMRLVLT